MDHKEYLNRMFPYAYNILGNCDDAKDAIQDVMTKYYSNNKVDIENEENYLIKSVVNQSINLKIKSKRWSGNISVLPEPVSTENADGNLIRKEIISYSLSVLLESVNPKERAVFILKEAFDYSHEDIGETLNISTENSRKLLSRAKLKVGVREEKKANKAVSCSIQLENYVDAVKNGDLKSLEAMMLADIKVKVDGGKLNIVSAFEQGTKDVINLMTNVFKLYQTEMDIKISSVNHQPALLFYQDARLINCQVFEFEIGTSCLSSIYSIVDPEKLKNFGDV